MNIKVKEIMVRHNHLKPFGARRTYAPIKESEWKLNRWYHQQNSYFETYKKITRFGDFVHENSLVYTTTIIIDRDNDLVDIQTESCREIELSDNDPMEYIELSENFEIRIIV